jgi:hypothetical protein
MCKANGFPKNLIDQSIIKRLWALVQLDLQTELHSLVLGSVESERHEQVRSTRSDIHRLKSRMINEWIYVERTERRGSEKIVTTDFFSAQISL